MVVITARTTGPFVDQAIAIVVFSVGDLLGPWVDVGIVVVTVTDRLGRTVAVLVAKGRVGAFIDLAVAVIVLAISKLFGALVDGRITVVAIIDPRPMPVRVCVDKVACVNALVDLVIAVVVFLVGKLLGSRVGIRVLIVAVAPFCLVAVAVIIAGGLVIAARVCSRVVPRSVILAFTGCVTRDLVGVKPAPSTGSVNGCDICAVGPSVDVTGQVITG